MNRFTGTPLTEARRRRRRCIRPRAFRNPAHGARRSVAQIQRPPRISSAMRGRVEGWRANFRVRWLFRRFRAGPQSGSHDRVSRPPLIKPDVQVSRIRLSDEIMPSPTEGVWQLHRGK